MPDRGVLDTSRVDWAECEESRREMRTGWRSGVTSTFVPICNRPCPHNEVTALVMRSFGQLPSKVFDEISDPVAAEWKRLNNHARRYREGSWSWRKTAESYTGQLRARYLEACRSLEEDGLSGRQDWYIRAFLKVEKNRKPDKAIKPRLIYPRSPRYNLELASRLKPFEHWLWGRLSGRVFGLSTPRLVAKGLNQRQRANMIVRKFNQFRRCVCFEVDGKAFEAHVGPFALSQGEHRVYKCAFPRDSRLATLLSKQVVLEGSTRCGAKFKRPGGRASGDFNTGMGNTLCFLVEVVAAMRGFGCPFDLFIDGDNALIFLEEDDSEGVLGAFARTVLLQSGHEVTLERPARRLEEVRFGGAAPVFLGQANGWVMVRDWHRILSGVFTSPVYLREPVFATEWMLGAAMCELSLSRGLPILQTFCLRAIAELRPRVRRKHVREHAFRDALCLGSWFASEGDAKPVTLEARLSFEAAFGVPPDEQVRIENDLLVSVNLSKWRHVTVNSLTDWLDEPGIHDTWQS